MITLTICQFLVSRWVRVSGVLSPAALSDDGTPHPHAGLPLDRRAAGLSGNLDRFWLASLILVAGAAWLWLGDLAESRAHEVAGGGWAGALAAGLEVRSFVFFVSAWLLSELVGVFLLYSAAGAEPLARGWVWCRAVPGRVWRWVRTRHVGDTLGLCVGVVLANALILGAVGDFWRALFTLVIAVAMLGAGGTINQEVAADRLDTRLPEVSNVPDKSGRGAGVG